MSYSGDEKAKHGRKKGQAIAAMEGIKAILKIGKQSGREKKKEVHEKKSLAIIRKQMYTEGVSERFVEMGKRNYSAKGKRERKEGPRSFLCTSAPNFVPKGRETQKAYKTLRRLLLRLLLQTTRGHANGLITTNVHRLGKPLALAESSTLISTNKGERGEGGIRLVRVAEAREQRELTRAVGSRISTAP